MSTIEFKPRTISKPLHNEGNNSNKISIFTNEDREVRKELVAACEAYFESCNSHLTNEQRNEFWYLCKAFNLNPLKREVYAVPFGGKIQIIVGYQMYAKWVAQTGLLEYKQFDVELDDNGVPKVGYAIVKRKDQTKEMKFTFVFREWKLDSPTWKSKPLFMFQKVMYANAMRWAFPEVLGDKPYTQEEMWFPNKQNDQNVLENMENEKEVEVTIVEKEKEENE